MAKPLKGSDEDMSSYKTRLVCSHIRNCLSHHRSGKKPLIVGVQGPQGSGKTTLTTSLVENLAQQSIKVAVFSIDDLYLPFAGLEEVAQRNAGNVLLAGRGQPGTHDVELGSKILRELSGINDGSASTVLLPIFDRSQNGGKGDRSADSVQVPAPLDVVVFEGWCLGFASLQPNALRQRYKAGAQGDIRCYFSSHALGHLETINANLAQLERAWYPYLDAFVQLVPQTIETVFGWRLEAEHAMKAKNGGKGMTDEEVRGFVKRYMPGYELFAEGVTQEDAPWKGRLLRIGLDEMRDVTFVES